MNDDALSIARAIGDRGRTRALFTSRHATVANDADAWDAFLAYLEARIPVFGVGFYVGALFTACAAYVWGLYR